ncbi:hypothetical protein ABW21_db0208342 [Orbilia brochopaga]|nr:hypothetical protein ABW21_db0208342 [Drechslerella brochopaga]
MSSTDRVIRKLNDDATELADLDGNTCSNPLGPSRLGDQGYRSALEPRTSEEVTYESLMSCGNVAMAKRYVTTHSFEDLVLSADVADSLEQIRNDFQLRIQNFELELDLQTLRIGLRNLQREAICILQKQSGSLQSTTTSTSAQTLIKWISRCEAKDLPTMTGGVLQASDHAQLCNPVYMIDRSTAGDEDYRRLALTLQKDEWKEVRHQWERIYEFVTGTSISAVAERDQANRPWEWKNKAGASRNVD